MSIQLITLKEYLMGRDALVPLTDEMKKDAKIMIDRANALLKEFGEYRFVTSGYRPFGVNEKIPNAAPHSNHTVCRAVDLKDKDGRLDYFCIQRQDILIQLGLWLESPTETAGWTHLQIVQPHSGHRIFIA